MSRRKKRTKRRSRREAGTGRGEEEGSDRSRLGDARLGALGRRRTAEGKSQPGRTLSRMPRHRIGPARPAGVDPANRALGDHQGPCQWISVEGRTGVDNFSLRLRKHCQRRHPVFAGYSVPPSVRSTE